MEPRRCGSGLRARPQGAGQGRARHLERCGQPFETGDPHFDALVVAHSGRVDETRERLLRESLGARVLELVRFNEPYEVSIRIERDAIVWGTDLTDRTPPTMIRGLLEELPRLQRLLFE